MGLLIVSISKYYVPLLLCGLPVPYLLTMLFVVFNG